MRNRRMARMVNQLRHRTAHGFVAIFLFVGAARAVEEPPAGEQPDVDGPRAVKQDEMRPERPSSRPARRSRDDVVDEELVRDLFGGGSGARDDVDETLSRMKRSADRLADGYDTGDATQRIQSQILSGLDRMIAAAEKAATSPRPSPSSRRKMGQPRRGETKKQRASEDPSAAGDANKKGGGTSEKRGVAESKKNGDRADLGRQWGFLPEQDREAVMQGMDESFMPRYREEIMRYYRNLPIEAARE